MSPHLLPRALCALVLGSALAFITVPAHAVLGGASRTWVSGVGDDANPCSRTAPCKTWAGAISKTADGGEIDALDPGGFGALTITQPITIDGGSGQVASTLSAGTNGIVIATAGNVVIRNLTIDNIGPTPGSPTCSLSGIKILNAASVALDHVRINNYDNGVAVPASSTAAGSTLSVSANDVTIENSACSGISATPDAGHAIQVALTNSDLNHDTVGFLSAAGAESWISGSQVSFNAKGLSGAGTTHDLCGNSFAGNTTNGTFTDHAAACQPPVTGAPAGQPTLTYCVVPNLRGKTKAAASAALTAQHCALGATHRKKGPRNKRGKVLSQTVPAGISVKEGTAVGVTVGK